MKLFCDLLARRRSNKKKETIKSLTSHIQSFNYSASPYSDQTSSLFDKQSRCTCHYFNVNENDSVNNHLQTVLNSPNSRSTINIENYSDIKYILTVADFCFWYDVRSTLLDIIDRVVAMNDTSCLIVQQIPSIKTEFCLTQSNNIHQRIKRPKTSIAIQTSYNNEQRRNAKVQTNTVTLFPLQKPNVSSTKLFFN